MHGPITHGSSAALSPRVLSVPSLQSRRSWQQVLEVLLLLQNAPRAADGARRAYGLQRAPRQLCAAAMGGRGGSRQNGRQPAQGGWDAIPKATCHGRKRGTKPRSFPQEVLPLFGNRAGGVLPSKTTRTLNASLCPQQRCVLKIAVRERAEGCAPCSSAMAAAKPRSCFPSPPSPPRSLLAALCRRETPQDRLQQQQRLGGMGRAALGAALGVWELEEGEGRAVRSPDCGSDRTACQCAAHAFFMRTCRWALRTAPEQRGAGRAALMGAANRAKVGGSPACVSPPYALVSLCSCPVPSRSAHPVWECKTVGGKLYLCPSAFPCPNAWLCCRLPAVQPWPKKKEKKAKKKEKKKKNTAPAPKILVSRQEKTEGRNRLENSGGQ